MLTISFILHSSCYLSVQNRKDCEIGYKELIFKERPCVGAKLNSKILNTFF
jgi:hypothetical protein